MVLRGSVHMVEFSTHVAFPKSKMLFLEHLKNNLEEEFEFGLFFLHFCGFFLITFCTLKSKLSKIWEFFGWGV